MLLAALDQTIVATALPTIVGDLGGLDHIVLGRHRLPAGRDGLDAAVRQARRPLRPQAPVPGRPSSSSWSAASCRASPRRWASSSPSGRSRASAPAGSSCWPGDHRRRRQPPRARPLPGLLRRGVRRRQRRRPAARRLLHRPPLVALGLLHQRARSASSRCSSPAPCCPPRVRRPFVRIDWVGTGAARRPRSRRLVLLTTWGGTEYAWGSPIIIGLGIATVVARRRVRAGRAAGRRARHPAAAVPHAAPS